MSTTHPIRRRCRYTAEFKQRLVALCQPGVSVSALALTHGLNANLLRRWISQYQNELPVSSELTKLVAVQVDLPAEPSVGDHGKAVRSQHRVPIQHPLERQRSRGLFILDDPPDAYDSLCNV